MGIITKTTNWIDNENVTFTDLNSDFDKLYNEVNGNLDNANIKSAANIDVTKIVGEAVNLTYPQSLTAKVISGALNTVTHLVDGANDLTDVTTNNATSLKHGFLPKLSGTSTTVLLGDGTWGTASQFKIGTFTRSQSAADGTQVVSGIGFQIKAVHFIASVDGQTGRSVGFDDGTSHYSSIESTAGTNRSTSLYSIETFNDASWDEKGYVSAKDADSFTVTWVKAGSPPSGTITVFYLAMG